MDQKGRMFIKDNIPNLSVRILFILLAAILGALAFLTLYRILGRSAFALMMAIPLFGGWILGMRGGILSLAIAVPLTFYLSTKVQLHTKEALLSAIPGTFIMLLLGTGMGRLRDLTFRVKRELHERKMAEEALPESEEKYKTLTNNLNVGVYRVSPGAKGRFLEANPAYLKIYGYESREQLFKSDVCDLYQNPADSKKFREKMQMVVRLPITK